MFKPILDRKVMLNKESHCPKISVITPSFSQSRFLERTILSVLNQNYPVLEYIIIDGGSTDGSVEIIRKYEKHLTYWVSEKDKGQADAINKGFRIATGEIVGWINSDDYYEPSCFFDVAKTFANDNNVGIVYGDNNIIDEYDEILTVNSSPNISVNKLLKGNPSVVQPGSFYRKNFLGRVGLLDENLHYVMDYDLWIRLGQISKICRIPKIVANFRLHALSKTKLRGYEFLIEIFKVRSRYSIRKFSWENRIILYWLLRNRLGYMKREILKM